VTSRAPLFLLALLIPACVTEEFKPPAVTPALVARAEKDRAGNGSIPVTRETLTAGRVLFLHRCLECHTLPVVTKYSRDEWPHLVNRMAPRANLTPEEEESVVHYLRAASDRPPDDRQGTL
jgi:mono/diheme cytochrome c family protein